MKNSTIFRISSALQSTWDLLWITQYAMIYSLMQKSIEGLQKLQLGRRGVDPCSLENVEPLPAGRGGSDGNMEIRGYRTRRARAETQTLEVKEPLRREDEEQSAAEQCEGGVEWDDEGC